MIPSEMVFAFFGAESLAPGEVLPRLRMSRDPRLQEGFGGGSVHGPSAETSRTPNNESANQPHGRQTMVSFEFLLTEWRPSRDCWLEGTLTDFGMRRITL